MIEVFFSYSHADEQLRDQLENHLAPLKREGVIEAWHDRKIIPGAPLDDSIDRYLEAADIVLLLISSDFVASQYCYGREMKRALERHDSGQARVIPVILRHCDWQALPFGHVVAVPGDGKPITSWPDRDEAFTDVARAVRRAAEELDEVNEVRSLGEELPATSPRSIVPTNADFRDQPRSSNLRVTKMFTDQEKDKI